MPANGRWDLIRRLKVKCMVTNISREMAVRMWVSVARLRNFEIDLSSVKSTFTLSCSLHGNWRFMLECTEVRHYFLPKPDKSNLCSRLYLSHKLHYHPPTYAHASRVDSSCQHLPIKILCAFIFFLMSRSSHPFWRKSPNNILVKNINYEANLFAVLSGLFT